MVENTPAPADLVEAFEDVLMRFDAWSPDDHSSVKRARAAIAAHQAHMANDGITDMDRAAADRYFAGWKAIDPAFQGEPNSICDEDSALAGFMAEHRRAAATIPQPDPRDAVIETLRAWLQNTINVIENGDLYRQQCCDGHMCGCQGSTHADEFVHYARAALANSEGK